MSLSSTFSTRPTVLSLFAGCGGLDLGFHTEGFDVLWANEFNPWAAQTYAQNFPNSLVDQRNVLEIDPFSDTSIPNADVIIGGFPCQDFSVIWQQPGLDGKRGSLYKEFLRFIDAKKPKMFVAENVKGILSANNGQAIKQIIADFAAITPGYRVSYKLVNFADYGVAQLRQRVIIVGVRSDLPQEFVFPQPTHGPDTDKCYCTVGEALFCVENVAFNNEAPRVHPRTIARLNRIPEGGNFADIPQSDPLYVKGLMSHVYRRIDRSKPSYTVIASGGGGSRLYHYPLPRPLTNREKARLQSFPDWFQFCGSPKEVCRQIGNAVPPVGARAIARQLMDTVRSLKDKQEC